MTYKETLFFIAKCLTINQEESNKIIVEKELKSENINWEAVVKISTAHFVFPALYCNIKKADFLNYLPDDLVNYMKHITDLNRERNQQIIEQAKEINDLLLANNITPIFLKGTGNLLEGLYDDIAERMVGDIDFIISKQNYPLTIKVLANFGYKKVHKTDYDFPQFKHYPRLNKKNNIAAVEIHKELLTEKYANEFNFNLIEKDTQNIDNITVLSFENQLALSIIAKQINDHGFLYKNITLRNAYDVFLLSKKTKALAAFNNLAKLKKPLNCFLSSCYVIFNKPNSLRYSSNKNTKSYLKLFNKFLNDDILRKTHHKKISKKIILNHRVFMTYKSIVSKEHRIWFKNTMTDKKWLRKKMIEFGLKKTKPNV
ncbi:nucleotidyltransferase family protein [Polaribacter sp. Asnod6-C07]|uniref:nucleotidyltransferase domain-containing protein n=1 Tax=Polaribacter sp. Asnod6-C07 TaxID=3160582 RepID=UPI00386B5E9B